MPGMMDTILNMGLNDKTVEGLAAKSGERFAWDSYRRLLDMYGNVVLGIDHALFEAELSAIKVWCLCSIHMFFLLPRVARVACGT
jgi:pyruvate, orthophosphate dikinase